MPHLLEADHELNEKYSVARTYYDADLKEKEAKATKEEVRERIIQLWGTGKNRLADIEVSFSSHNSTTMDYEALDAFLASHGKARGDFQKPMLSSRLTVKKV